MLTGRKFAARFKNSSAREAYLTWSAGQMFIYNECVLEQRFFDSLSRLIAETERHKPVSYTHLTLPTTSRV